MVKGCIVVIVALLMGIGVALAETPPRGELVARSSQVVRVKGDLAVRSEKLAPTLKGVKGTMLYHDDGSFEDALGIYSTKPDTALCDSTFALANSFFVSQTCSLQSALIYFDYRTDRDFYLWIWDDQGGTPLYQDCQVAGPPAGAEGWWTVHLDSLVPVSDTFWIGAGYSYLWGEPEWYIGFDTDTPDTHAAINVWGTPDRWENLCEVYGYCHAFGIRAVIKSDVPPDHDVGCVSIDVPGPTVCPNIEECPPKATVANYGAYVESFDVVMTIEPGGYANTHTVVDLDAIEGNNTRQITFDPWFTGNEGDTFTVTVYTQLDGDEYTHNDTCFRWTVATGWQSYDDDSCEAGHGLVNSGVPEPDSNTTIGFATMFADKQCEGQAFKIDTIAIWFDEFNDDDFRLYVWGNDRTCDTLFPQPNSHGIPIYVNMESPQPTAVGQWTYYTVEAVVSDTFWVGVCYNTMGASIPTWKLGYDDDTIDYHTKYTPNGVQCDWKRGDEWGGPDTSLVRAFGIRIHKVPIDTILFIRGDAEADDPPGPGTYDVDLFDGLRIIYWLGGSAPAPPCVEAADAEDDEPFGPGTSDVDLFDGLRVIYWLGGSAAPPPPPNIYTGCGTDPTPDEGICESYPPCDTKKGAAAIKPAAPVGSAEESKLTVVSGESDVTVTVTSAEALVGFNFVIEYDAEQATAKFVDNTGLVTEGFDVFVSGTSEPGVVKVVGVSDIDVVDGENKLPAGEHRVARIVFEGKAPASLKVDNSVMAAEYNRALNHHVVVKAVPRPEAFQLDQNYPNPFNPETEIRYALPVDCRVNLEIYNILGQKVATLVDEHQKAGHKSVHWDSRSQTGNEVSSGLYFYRLQAGDFVETKRMVLLK